MPRTVIEPKPIRKQVAALAENALDVLSRAARLKAAVQIEATFELTAKYAFDGDEMVSLGGQVKANLPPEVPLDVGVTVGSSDRTEREADGEMTVRFIVKGSV